MTVERYIHIFAGLFILVSLALGVEGSPLFISKWALAFTAFVGANLFDANYGPPNRAPRMTQRLVDGKLKCTVLDPRFSKLAAKAKQLGQERKIDAPPPA